MKKTSISTLIIGLTLLLTCATQAACIEVNSINTPGDATASFVIVKPGSYCLPDNVAGVSGKNGIRIDTDDVTLDLAGYAMIGVSGSLNESRFVTARLAAGAVMDWTARPRVRLGSMICELRTMRGSV